MKNLFLLLGVVVLVLIPLIMFHGDESVEFGGADGEAEAAITEIATDYEPWFEPLWEPPSGEIESMLFSLQAAFGSGIICFGMGWFMGRKNAAGSSA